MHHRPFTAATTAALLAGAMACISTPAQAALKVGDAAPAVHGTGALAGEIFDFDLAAALAQGPVVIYFFPKAFTRGCTIEAKAFADATPHFATRNATVVGISHDDIETLQRFSTEACHDQFAVVSDPDARTIKAYDAASLMPGVASRISYVIASDGRIAAVHKGSDPLQHVEMTWRAVQELTAGQP